MKKEIRKEITTLKRERRAAWRRWEQEIRILVTLQREVKARIARHNSKRTHLKVAAKIDRRIAILQGRLG